MNQEEVCGTCGGSGKIAMMRPDGSFYSETCYGCAGNGAGRIPVPVVPSDDGEHERDEGRWLLTPGKWQPEESAPPTPSQDAEGDGHEVEGYHWIETECCVVCDEPVVEVEGRGWEHANERMSAVIDSLTAERDRLRDEAMHASALLDGVGLCREHFPTTERGWLPCIKCGELAAEADRERLREALRKVEVAHFDKWCALCLGGEAPALHKPDCPVGAALATPPSEGQS